MYCIFILILLLLLIIAIVFYVYPVYWHELCLMFHLLYPKRLEQNIQTMCKNYKNRILIVSYDNRPNLEFVKIHVANVSAYCSRWNIDYQFLTECKHNTYFCKIYMVLEALQTNLYDYVVWMDTDIIIIKPEIDLNTIINKYDSDIYIGTELVNTSVCSGFFIIKNSVTGRELLEDCIRFFNKHRAICTNNTGQLNGRWGGICYEQGALNYLIFKYDKYYDATTILKRNVIDNVSECRAGSFMLHYCRASSQKRAQCFKRILYES
jgi:hypothetical protein